MGSPRYDEIVDLLQQTNGEGASAAAPEAPTAEEPDEDAGEMLAEESVVHERRRRDPGRRDHRGRQPAVGQRRRRRRRTSMPCTSARSRCPPPWATSWRSRTAPTRRRATIRRTAISFVRYPGGLDWKGKQVKFVVGIAGAGKDHLPLLGKIAQVFADKEQVAELEAAESVADVRRILGGVSTALTGQRTHPSRTGRTPGPEPRELSSLAPRTVKFGPANWQLWPLHRQVWPP